MAKAKKKTMKKKTAAKAKPKKAAKKAPAKKIAPKKAKVSKKSSVKKPMPKKSAAKKSLMKKSVVKKPAMKKAPSAKKPTAPKQKKAAAQPAALKKTASAAPKRVTADLSDFVTPLDDRIIVRLTEAERTTPGGLFIPDTVSDVSGNLEGRVVAVGRGHRDPKGRIRPMDVKAGDRVVFSEYSGSKIRLKDEDFVILREGDVAGVLA